LPSLRGRMPQTRHGSLSSLRRFLRKVRRRMRENGGGIGPLNDGAGVELIIEDEDRFAVLYSAKFNIPDFQPANYRATLPWKQRCRGQCYKLVAIWVLAPIWNDRH
jgi:hypothetical protein